MEALRLSELLHQVHWAVGNAVLTRMWPPGHDQYFDQIGAVVSALIELEKACKALDLSVSAVVIARTMREFQHLRRAVELEIANTNTVPQLASTVVQAIVDETATRFYFHLPERSRELYSERQPFGAQVSATFPEANTDIEEAAKCLSLERATASVFHSMRAVEFGLRTIVVQTFGDTDFFKDVSTWGAICNRIRREANKADDKIAAQWIGKQDRLTKLALLVQQVGEAFRHPTMHCVSTYTVEQARDLFHASGSFMRRLAEDIAPALNQAR